MVLKHSFTGCTAGLCPTLLFILSCIIYTVICFQLPYTCRFLILMGFPGTRVFNGIRVFEGSKCDILVFEGSRCDIRVCGEQSSPLKMTQFLTISSLKRKRPVLHFKTNILSLSLIGVFWLQKTPIYGCFQHIFFIFFYSDLKNR